MAEGEGVRHAQRFEIAQLETGLLRFSDDLVHRDQLTVGEDVGIDESWSDATNLAVPGDDAVVEEDPFRVEQPLDPGEVGRQVPLADMLEHPH